jgi:hypothetical protein
MVRKLSPHATPVVRFAEPPWNEQSVPWRQIDAQLPPDHLAREIRQAMTHLDLTVLYASGRNEMDPPLCGSTSMSHNDFKIREPMEPQEASPMKQEMSVLGIDIAKRVFHAVGMDNTGEIVFRKR